jgi:hypothetical protein
MYALLLLAVSNYVSGSHIYFFWQKSSVELIMIGSWPALREGPSTFFQLYRHSLLCVTTRPYDARRDAPLSRRQTRHNERSSETEGNALSLLFYYFSNLEPATLGISTSAKALSCFPPIIGNLNIATISHLASL